MAKIGDQLKAAREERGETLSEAAQATRIKVQQLEGMENDDFSSIPAPTYIKGFIRLYGRHLALDPEGLVQCYLEEAAEESAGSVVGLQAQVLQRPDEPPEEVQVAAAPVADSSELPPAKEEPGLGELFSAASVASEPAVSAPNPAPVPVATPRSVAPSSVGGGTGPGGIPRVAPGTPRLTAAGTQVEPPRPFAEVLPYFIKGGVVLALLLVGLTVLRSCMKDDPVIPDGPGNDVPPVVSGEPLIDGPVLIEAPGEPFTD